MGDNDSGSKAVLITGCSTGIGRATAEYLTGRGHTVYATARRLESIADLEAKGCKVLPCDVTDEGSMQRAVAAVEEIEGAVGVLINNAGYAQDGPIEAVPMDAVRRQFETNVFGLARMAQLVLPGMRRQRWGRIINISSVGGRVVFPGGGYYHATKWAVEAISDALRFEVRPFGIDVAVIEPGAIATSYEETSRVQIAGGEAGSPYEEFTRNRIERVEAAYGGKTAAPEAVAKVIAHAVEAKRPRTRYTVTSQARMVMSLRRVLPDRAWDRFIGTQFKPPVAK
jgi:NAD(P)-dependent dehydrogenase (short-subunit alcohol dehydrogenase family)